MKKTILFLTILFSTILLSACTKNPSQETLVPTKTFTINAANFSFDPKEIKVKLNDVVKITINNLEGNHDLVIDEFGVKTKLIGASESDSITFRADKTGSFQYYCSVGSHRAIGMWGTLVVE